MMRIAYIVFVAVIAFGFVVPSHKTSGATYTQEKQYVKSLIRTLDTNKVDYDSIGNLFCDAMLNHIVPHWYATPWSFEGYTATPKKGTIACGYFVATTLRDMGLVVDRYALAQQVPVNEAKTLALNTSVHCFEQDDLQKNIAAIKKTCTHGLYFIGFAANHVGFLYANKHGVYLIHSNYINAQGVMKEKIEDSEVFASYAKFYIVAISTNRVLMQKWLSQTKINVVKK